MWKYITDKNEMMRTVEIINRQPYVGLDIETNGLNVFSNSIRVVQIAIPDEDETTFIYDARALDLKPFLDALSFDPIYVLHNGKFDLKFLRYNYGFLPTKLFDTMIAETLLTCGIGQLMTGLSYLTNKYLGYGLVKEIRDSFLEDTVFLTDQQLNYAADDSVAEIRLYPVLSAKIEKTNLSEVADIEFRLTRVLVDMELRGVRFDDRIWKHFSYVTLERQITAERNLRELYSKVGFIEVERKHKGVVVKEKIAAESINLNSSQQLIPVLRAFGIKVDSTSFETLSNIDHAAVKALIEYRKYSKRLSAFGQSYIDDYVMNGRIHAGINQIGAYTGRFSYENPNLQQVPNPAKDISADINYRLAFISDEGYDIIKADYSQIELRIAAQISGEPKFIDNYIRGRDLHKLTASNVFKIPYDEVGKDSKERSISKNINFATLYGSGPNNLVSKFQISKPEAVRILDEFHKAYPVLSACLKELGNETIINGYAKTILGRRRNFRIPGFNSPDFMSEISAIRREGGNHAIQGTSADMTKLGMVLLYERSQELGGQLLITVHDEIVSQFPVDRSKDGSDLVRQCMIEAGSRMITDLPVEVDVRVGKSWGG